MTDRARDVAEKVKRLHFVATFCAVHSIGYDKICREAATLLEQEHARAEKAEAERDNLRLAHDILPHKRAHAIASKVPGSLGRNVWDIVIEQAERAENLELALISVDHSSKPLKE